MPSSRYRSLVFAIISFSIIFVVFSTYQLRDSLPVFSSPKHTYQESSPDVTSDVPAPPKKEYPKYKPTAVPKSFPIVDNFPLAAAAKSSADLPPIALWNNPPSPHVPEKTPLFIGFTRNWRLLQQAVVSYIAAGWPPSDIYVVENTGVMESNKLGLLNLQNPFFLNHTRLETILGVNILITPTLLTFAQLQNFYIWTSTQNKWPVYFWSHMDVAAFPFEDQYAASHPNVSSSPSADNAYPDYRSIYTYSVDALRDATKTDPQTGKQSRWAMRFFSYDRLALVNVASFQEVGGWDTLIPFYMTDCDMHARLDMAKLDIQDRPAGMVFDVASSLDDLIVLYRKKGTVQASFKDPNVVEEELSAIAQSEQEMQKAALEKSDNVKSTTVRSEKRVEMNTDNLDNFPKSSIPEYGPSSVLASSTMVRAVAWEDDTIWSEQAKHLVGILNNMQGSKFENKAGRNTWQARQTGGQGDPFYRDSEGFQIGIEMTIEHGKAVFREKWGHRDCDIVAMGLKTSDAWRVEHDWK